MALLYDLARVFLFLLAVAGLSLFMAAAVGVLCGLLGGPGGWPSGRGAVFLLGGGAAAVLAIGGLFWFSDHVLFRRWPGEARRHSPFG